MSAPSRRRSRAGRGKGHGAWQTSFSRMPPVYRPRPIVSRGRGGRLALLAYAVEQRPGIAVGLLQPLDHQRARRMAGDAVGLAPPRFVTRVPRLSAIAL